MGMLQHLTSRTPIFATQRLFTPHNGYFHYTPRKPLPCSCIYSDFIFPARLPKKGNIFTTIERPPNAFRTAFERLLNALERLRLATGTPMPNHA